MSQIIILYHSGRGHTKKLANFILEGLQSQQTLQAELINVEELDEKAWNKLHQAEAIIMGSPTYMGSVSAEFKAFMDKTADFWLDQPWTDKIAAGFTVGTGPSGDKLNSLMQLSVFAMQHGMIWVGQNMIGSKHTEDGQGINESGSWLGHMSTSDTDKSQLIRENDAITAKLFGKRIATITERWVSGKATSQFKKAI